MVKVNLKTLTQKVNFSIWMGAMSQCKREEKEWTPFHVTRMCGWQMDEFLKLNDFDKCSAIIKMSFSWDRCLEEI